MFKLRSVRYVVLTDTDVEQDYEDNRLNEGKDMVTDTRVDVQLHKGSFPQGAGRLGPPAGSFWSWKP